MSSDLGRWAACEAQAMRGYLTSRKMPASAWVAALAHEAEVEGSEDALPVAFDALTPIGQTAIRQARMIREAVSEQLSRVGWKTVALGVKNPTIVVETQELEYGIVRVRTGSQLGSSWLELGEILQETTKWPMAFGAVLHAPRTSVHKPQPSNLYRRDAVLLINAAHVVSERKYWVLQGQQPTHTPGPHCRHCSLTECAVRSVPGPNDEL